MRDDHEARAWLRSVPGVLDEACAKWSLTVDSPFEGSHVSLVFPAIAGGEAVALKIQFPHRESDHEAAALRAWDGGGAVRLIDEAPELHTLLLERCDPGTPLADVGPETSLPVLADLVRQLSIPADGPFVRLTDEAKRWAEQLPSRWERAGRPFESSLVDRAIDLLGSLADPQRDRVLVHQDLHGKNVLRARRQHWLAIDPKPLLGEVEFAIAPIVRSHELGHSQPAVLHQLSTLVDALGLDASRAWGWCFAQTVAWSISGDSVLPRHVEVARWLLAA